MSEKDIIDRRNALRSIGALAGVTAFTGVGAGMTGDDEANASEEEAETNWYNEYEYDHELTSIEEKEQVYEVNVIVEKSHRFDRDDVEVQKFAYEVPKSDGDEPVKGGEVDAGDHVSPDRSHHPIPPDAEDVIVRWGFWGELEEECDAVSGNDHVYFGLTFELTEGANGISQTALTSAVGALAGAALGSVVPGGGTGLGAAVGFFSGIAVGVFDYFTSDSTYTIATNEWDQWAPVVGQQPMTTIAAANSYDQRDKSKQTRIGVDRGHPFEDVDTEDIDLDELPSP